MTSFVSAETHTVWAFGGGFQPATVVVAPGDTIIWESIGSHTVTSGDPCTADGLFNGELSGDGDTFTWDVPLDASEGDITYFCQPHCGMGMTGVIAIDAGSATIHVPGDYPTIAQAIGAATYDDIINIAAGTYYEANLAVGAIDITLRGEANPDGTPAVTIDAQQQGRVFEMVCDTHPPPGIAGLVIFDTLVITGGAVAGNGGGVSITTCSPTFLNCTITQNSCTDNGGGVYVYHQAEGAPWASADVNFIDCTIIGNDAQDGGGMFSRSNGYNNGAQPSLVDCLVTENTASDGVGGIRHATSPGQTTVVNSIICGNEGGQVLGDVELDVDSCAAAICLDDDGDGVPDGCVYDEDGILHVPEEYPTIASALENALDGQTIVIAAGTYMIDPDTIAIDLQSKSLTITGATHEDGTPAVTIDGGGIFISGAAANGTTIENIRVINTGGGLSIIDCEASVTNCIFEGNFSLYGGGAYISNAYATLSNCIFRNNWAYTGGGVVLRDGPLVILIDCLIEGNVGSYMGTYGVGGVHVQSGTLTMINCTVRENLGGEVGGVKVDAVAALAMSDSTVCGNTPENEISGEWTDNGGNTIADECPADCAGDLDGDGVVSVDDLLALLAAYQTNGGGDCDGDGDTDVDDLLILIGSWGPCNA